MNTVELSLTEWLDIIRGEYLEIPGLHLTRPQAQRLWGLDSRTCDALLGSLVRSGFLTETPSGHYARADQLR